MKKKRYSKILEILFLGILIIFTLGFLLLIFILFWAISLSQNSAPLNILLIVISLFVSFLGGLFALIFHIKIYSHLHKKHPDTLKSLLDWGYPLPKSLQLLPEYMRYNRIKFLEFINGKDKKDKKLESYKKFFKISLYIVILGILSTIFFIIISNYIS